MRTNRTRIFERKKEGGIDDSVNHTISIDHNSFDEFMQRLRSYTGSSYRIVCVTFRDTKKPLIDLTENTYKQLNANHLVSVIIARERGLGLLLETMHKRISRLEQHLRYSSGHGFVI